MNVDPGEKNGRVFILEQAVQGLWYVVETISASMNPDSILVEKLKIKDRMLVIKAAGMGIFNDALRVSCQGFPIQEIRVLEPSKTLPSPTVDGIIEQLKFASPEQLLRQGYFMDAVMAYKSMRAIGLKRLPGFLCHGDIPDTNIHPEMQIFRALYLSDETTYFPFRQLYVKAEEMSDEIAGVTIERFLKYVNEMHSGLKRISAGKAQVISKKTYKGFWVQTSAYSEVLRELDKLFANTNIYLLGRQKAQSAIREMVDLLNIVEVKPDCEQDFRLEV